MRLLEKVQIMLFNRWLSGYSPFGWVKIRLSNQ